LRNIESKEAIVRHRNPAFFEARSAIIATGVALVLGQGFAGTPQARAAAGPDTLGVRFEIGAASDVTNEYYYEYDDAVVDSTFLTRQISSPETRVAGVFLAAMAGTRGQRATRYALQNELRLGDKLKSNTLSMSWYDDFAPVWRLSVLPVVEYRKDQTFERDLEEWRGSLASRLRHDFGDGTTFGEARIRGEFLRTSGSGANYIRDRNSGQIGVAIDHLALFGHEWRLGYKLTARQFPDTTERDHFEHGFEARWRLGTPGGHTIALEADAQRRVTIHPVPTSGDNFWEQWVRGETSLRLSESWTFNTRAEFEGFQYDVQDTAIYFNYNVGRVRLGPRFDRLASWSVSFGPAGEILRSALNPAESYQEIGGYLEVEFLGLGGWWSVSPNAGWRAYEEGAGDAADLGVHSSFAYYELSLFGDQRLPGGMRLRAVATARTEPHTDSIDNATSLYFSVDVRRLF
jgi:hypothetical protein